LHRGAEAFVELAQPTGRGAERASCVAAEDERDRLRAAERAQRERGPGRRRELEVRRGIADLGPALAVHQLAVLRARDAVQAVVEVGAGHEAVVIGVEVREALVGTRVLGPRDPAVAVRVVLRTQEAPRERLLSRALRRALLRVSGRAVRGAR